jgi:hypothetical protein
MSIKEADYCDLTWKKEHLQPHTPFTIPLCNLELGSSEYFRELKAR